MKLYIILIIMFIQTVVAAQKTTLSGVVTDASTGETLVNATVILKAEKLRGVSTNDHGFFSMPGIECRQLEIEISYIGYQSETRTIYPNCPEPVFIEVALAPSEVHLEQVTVTGLKAEQLGDSDVEISLHTLTPKQIREIPTARNDVFKALRHLPGIEPTEPLSPLISVRGSDPGENLIMLDGVTIYNPYHFMSSSGIFNMQTVKRVDMMVGGFGAEYGGRNASVINISTKDGNNNKLHGEVQPTTSESKVFLEFPVGKKTTMLVAGRFNYDIPGNFLMYSNNYFYDMNLSLTHRFNARNRLTIKYFGSADHTKLDFNNYYKYIGNSTGMEDVFNNMSLKWVNKWENNIATAIWHSVLSPKVFLKAQLSASMHRADNSTEMRMFLENTGFDTSTLFRSRVDDYTAKTSISYKPFIWNEFKAGVEYSNYRFMNASELNGIDNGKATKLPVSISVFAEDKINIGFLTIRPGIRIVQFNNNHLLYEPRANAVAKLPGSIKLQVAYGLYNQQIVSMNTQEFEFNQFLDYYYPLTQHQPSKSEHYIFGAEKQFGVNHTVTANFYFKDISCTYTFDLLQDQYEVFALSDKIVAGTGKAYGAELMWNGRLGNFSGWASYTLSKSTRSFPHIMDGASYDYDYDRRHSFKTVLNYQATQRISYSMSLIAQSGVPRSIENSLQMYYIYDPLTGTMMYSPQYTVNQKNASRMPWLLYLDFGMQKKLATGFGKDLADFFGADESYFVLNLYNVLFFRRNILYYIPAVGLDKMIPIGDNYLPIVSAGFTIKF
jgi:hypothetical protein